MKLVFHKTQTIQQEINVNGNFGLSKNNVKLSLEKKSGHWSEKEQARYYAFLDKFEEKFNEKESRRQCKIFKAMSSFIKTRDPNQCRSHHHKMTKSFENIRQALDALSVKNQFLRKRSQKYGEELERIDKISREGGELGGESESLNSNGKQETMRLCVNQTYFDQMNLPKILDIGSLRTDVTENCGEFPIQDYQKSQFSVGLSSFKGFPSTGLLTPTMATISPCTSNLVSFCNLIPESYGMENLSVFEKERQQKWLQCHEYFMKWLNKLNSLIGEGF